MLTDAEACGGAEETVALYSVSGVHGVAGLSVPQTAVLMVPSPGNAIKQPRHPVVDRTVPAPLRKLRAVTWAVRTKARLKATTVTVAVYLTMESAASLVS